MTQCDFDSPHSPVYCGYCWDQQQQSRQSATLEKLSDSMDTIARLLLDGSQVPIPNKRRPITDIAPQNGPVPVPKPQLQTDERRTYKWTT